MARIKVFSQPTCPACNELKEYLKSKGAEFDDLDITTNKEAREELIRVHKVRVTPFIVTGEKKLIGFDPVEVDKLLTGKT